jgi:hypothetical protein
MATYRQQSGLGLAAENTCPSCSTSWKATNCNNPSTVYYLDKLNGYQGSQSIVLSYSYSVGDVVWVKNSPSGAIYCATITANSSSPPLAYKIDENANSGNGPYSNCSSCTVP